MYTIRTHIDIFEEKTKIYVHTHRIEIASKSYIFVSNRLHRIENGPGWLAPKHSQFWKSPSHNAPKPMNVDHPRFQKMPACKSPPILSSPSQAAQIGRPLPLIHVAWYKATAPLSGNVTDNSKISKLRGPKMRKASAFISIIVGSWLVNNFWPGIIGIISWRNQGNFSETSGKIIQNRNEYIFGRTPLELLVVDNPGEIWGGPKNTGPWNPTIQSIFNSQAKWLLVNIWSGAVGIIGREKYRKNKGNKNGKIPEVPMSQFLVECCWN